MAVREENIGAYYKNKPYKMEVYTMEDLRKIKDAPEVPLIVSFANEITEEKYENEKELILIERLLTKYKKLVNRTWTFSLKSKEENLKEIEEKLQYLYKKITGNNIDLSDLKKTEEELKNCRSRIKYRKDTMPIDLSGRKESILIKGIGHSLSDITIHNQKENDTLALFTNVDCDLSFIDLNIENLKVYGKNNVAALAAGTGKEGNSPTIQLFNVNVDAELYGLDNVAELLVNFNKATIEGRNFSYDVKINGIEKKGSVTNKFKLKVPVNSYFDARDYTNEVNSPVSTFTRTRKKND